MLINPPAGATLIGGGGLLEEWQLLGLVGRSGGRCYDHPGEFRRVFQAGWAADFAFAPGYAAANGQTRPASHYAAIGRGRCGAGD